MKKITIVGFVAVAAFGFLAAAAQAQEVSEATVTTVTINIQTLTEFFGWITFINFGLLMLVNGFLIFAKDIIYPLFNWAHPMSKESFNILNAAGLMFFKTLWGVFNLVPFLALLIMGAG